MYKSCSINEEMSYHPYQIDLFHPSSFSINIKQLSLLHRLAWVRVCVFDCVFVRALLFEFGCIFVCVCLCVQKIGDDRKAKTNQVD